MLHPGGVVVEGVAPLAQDLTQRRPVKPGQIPDGVYPIARQHPGRRPPHKQQVGHRQGPQQLLIIVPGDDGGGVRLFVVAAHFGKDLVEGHPNRHGKPQLLPHCPADPVGQPLAVGVEQVESARHVQPALVDGKGLHQVGVPFVNGVDFPGIFPVLTVVGGEEDQVGALPAGLPDGLGGLDLECLGRLIFGQNDPVTAIWVAAHRYRLIP